MLNDADGQVLYYRRDVLNDPANQAAFKAAVGYDLPVPPRTWQQVLDIARFFAGKNWDHHDSQPDSGMVLHLKPGEQGFYHFQSLVGARSRWQPGPTVDRYHNVYWFDPQDMKPLINEPGHVAALELLQQLDATGPADQIGWRLPQAWDYFLRGKAVMMFTWGDLGALCQDETRSLVKGNCGVAMLPGSSRYWDREQAQWVEPAEPNRVGNTTGGSWHGVLLAGSPNQEAAYSFLALMAIKPVSLVGRAAWLDRHQSRLRAIRCCSPQGEARLADYHQGRLGPRRRRGLSRRLPGDLQRADHAALSAHPRHARTTGRPWTRSSPRPWAAARPPKQALDDTAAAWDKITDRLGRDQQLQEHQKAIGYQPGQS